MGLGSGDTFCNRGTIMGDSNRGTTIWAGNRQWGYILVTGAQKLGVIIRAQKYAEWHTGRNTTIGVRQCGVNKSGLWLSLGERFCQAKKRCRVLFGRSGHVQSLSSLQSNSRTLFRRSAFAICLRTTSYRAVYSQSTILIVQREST